MGTEELPAADLDIALQQLRERVPALLRELRLEHGEVRILGTPRRLVVIAEAVSPRQTDMEQLAKGPPAERAYDPSGAPTKAAEGFARSKGLEVSDLEVREMDGGRYVVAIVRQAGQHAPDVLAEALPNLIASIRFDKSMRWNRSNVAFSRPVRWLLALFGEQVLPFEYAGLVSGNVTRGLRFHQPEEIRVSSVKDYFNALAAQGIILDQEDRRNTIREQVENLAAEVGGAVLNDPALLEEVTNLVEAPTALRGTFDPTHLDLPREVLVSVMKKHQRYFPVFDAQSEVVRAKSSSDHKSQLAENVLLPYFIAVRNGDGFGLERVIEGNEHVIRARFADAAYFVREDSQHPLQNYLPRLRTLTFQTKLGSMLDKVVRIGDLVSDLAPTMQLTQEETSTARRAAELCKADLATHMVVEMTSLQGWMGRYYAMQSGEPAPVADAIYEHYLPRFAGDAPPQERPGLIVGLADRLDTLAGLFAADLAPSGNKDPFAQRRAALGLVHNLISWELDFDLHEAIQLAAGHLPITASRESQAACLTFIIERLRNLILEQGWRYDVVDAVLAEQGRNPWRTSRAVKELSSWVQRSDWNTILPAYARCVRITRDQDERYAVDPGGFVEAAEGDLFAALEAGETACAGNQQQGSPDVFLSALLPMIPAINRFFDDVLVMAEDEKIRHNRLGVVQRIAALAQGVADMSRLEGF